MSKKNTYSLLFSDKLVEGGISLENNISTLFENADCKKLFLKKSVSSINNYCKDNVLFLSDNESTKHKSEAENLLFNYSRTGDSSFLNKFYILK